MFPNLTFFSLFKSEHTAHLHIPILWGAGLLDQKLPGDFQFFQGIFFSLNSRKWERRKSSAPGTHPAALQLKATLWFLADSPLCCSREGKLSQIFRSCLQGEGTQSVFPEEQASTGLMLPERRAGSSGVISLTAVLKPPHLWIKEKSFLVSLLFFKLSLKPPLGLLSSSVYFFDKWRSQFCAVS